MGIKTTRVRTRSPVPRKSDREAQRLARAILRHSDRTIARVAELVAECVALLARAGAR